MRARVGKEYARQIQPTRNHAPTEYNLQYKRWPQNSGDTSKPFVAKKGPIKPGRIWSSSKPKQTNDTNLTDCPVTHVDEVSGGKATCGTDSYLDLLSFDGLTTDDAKGSLSSALQTPPLQLHTRQDIKGVSKSLGAQKDSKCGNRRSKHYSTESAPPNVKKAWLSREEEERYQKFLQDDISSKLQCLSVHSSAQSMKSIATTTNKSVKIVDRKCSGWGAQLSDETLSKRQNKVSSSNTEKRGPIPTRRTSFEGFSNKSTNPFCPYTEYDDEPSAVPHLKAGGKILTPQSPRTGMRRDKNINSNNGISENDLRKIYIDASEDELKRLKKNFKSIIGSKQNRNETAKKKGSIELPFGKAEQSMTKDELDNLRVAAFRCSQKAVGLQHKDVWETSYATDFCRDWTNYRSGQPEDIQEYDKETKPESSDVDDEEGDDEKQDVEEGEQAEEVEIKDSTDPDNNKKSENQHTPIKAPRSSSSEREKILQEAQAIEEREYRGLFKGDGKPKMNLDSTYGYTHRGHLCKKPETPVGADKTMVSLGSGHWNLLRDHYDGWVDDKKKTNHSIPKNKHGRDKYKIKIYEFNEVCPSRIRRSRDMIMGSYGGGARQPRRTNVSYMTEYMRTFTRLPLPKKQIRI